jgi:predicted alpha/beta hydrolase family esterase
MQKVLIFHGTAGHPEENWFPWLKGELEEQNCTVIVPQFPTPEGQSVQSWLEVLGSYPDAVTPDSIIVGHSLGGIFLLRILEQLEQPIKAAVFTGTPIGVRPIKNYDSDNSFSGFDFDWEKIRRGAKYFEVFHSDNDPYVDLANGEKLARELGIELTFVPGAGHFNASAGYTKFPLLLKKLEPVLPKKSA